MSLSELIDLENKKRIPLTLSNISRIIGITGIDELDFTDKTDSDAQLYVHLFEIFHEDGDHYVQVENKDLPCLVNDVEVLVKEPVLLTHGSIIKVADRFIRYVGPDGSFKKTAPYKPQRTFENCLDSKSEPLQNPSENPDTSGKDEDGNQLKYYNNQQNTNNDNQVKDFIEHLQTADQIGNLASSYVTREILQFTDLKLSSKETRDIFKTFRVVAEQDEGILVDFIADYYKKEQLNATVGIVKPVQEPVVKLLTDLLRFSLEPVSHNITWLRLLSPLSQSKNNLPFFVSYKVAASIMGAMAACPVEAGIQQYGCEVLSQLASCIPNLEEKAPVRETGIELITMAVKTHPTNRDIIYPAFHAVANVAEVLVSLIEKIECSSYNEHNLDFVLPKYESLLRFIKRELSCTIETVRLRFRHDAGIQSEIRRLTQYLNFSTTHLNNYSLQLEPGQRKKIIPIALEDSTEETCPSKGILKYPSIGNATCSKIVHFTESTEGGSASTSFDSESEPTIADPDIGTNLLVTDVDENISRTTSASTLRTTRITSAVNTGKQSSTGDQFQHEDISNTSATAHVHADNKNHAEIDEKSKTGTSDLQGNVLTNASKVDEVLKKGKTSNEFINKKRHHYEEIQLGRDERLETEISCSANSDQVGIVGNNSCEKAGGIIMEGKEAIKDNSYIIKKKHYHYEVIQLENEASFSAIEISPVDGTASSNSQIDNPGKPVEAKCCYEDTELSKDEIVEAKTNVNVRPSTESYLLDIAENLLETCSTEELDLIYKVNSGKLGEDGNYNTGDIGKCLTLEDELVIANHSLDNNSTVNDIDSVTSVTNKKVRHEIKDVYSGAATYDSSLPNVDIHKTAGAISANQVDSVHYSDAMVGKLEPNYINSAATSGANYSNANASGILSNEPDDHSQSKMQSEHAKTEMNTKERLNNDNKGDSLKSDQHMLGHDRNVAVSQYCDKDETIDTDFKEPNSANHNVCGIPSNGEGITTCQTEQQDPVYRNNQFDELEYYFQYSESDDEEPIFSSQADFTESMTQRRRICGSNFTPRTNAIMRKWKSLATNASNIAAIKYPDSSRQSNVNFGIEPSYSVNEYYMSKDSEMTAFPITEGKQLATTNPDNDSKTEESTSDELVTSTDVMSDGNSSLLESVDMQPVSSYGISGTYQKIMGQSDYNETVITQSTSAATCDSSEKKNKSESSDSEFEAMFTVNEGKIDKPLQSKKKHLKGIKKITKYIKGKTGLGKSKESVGNASKQDTIKVRRARHDYEEIKLGDGSTTSEVDTGLNKDDSSSSLRTNADSFSTSETNMKDIFTTEEDFDIAKYSRLEESTTSRTLNVAAEGITTCHTEQQDPVYKDNQFDELEYYFQYSESDDEEPKFSSQADFTESMTQRRRICGSNFTPRTNAIMRKWKSLATNASNIAAIKYPDSSRQSNVNFGIEPSYSVKEYYMSKDSEMTAFPITEGKQLATTNPDNDSKTEESTSDELVTSTDVMSDGNSSLLESVDMQPVSSYGISGTYQKIMGQSDYNETVITQSTSAATCDSSEKKNKSESSDSEFEAMFTVNEGKIDKPLQSKKKRLKGIKKITKYIKGKTGLGKSKESVGNASKQDALKVRRARHDYEEIKLGDGSTTSEVDTALNKDDNSSSLRTNADSFSTSDSETNRKDIFTTEEDFDIAKYSRLEESTTSRTLNVAAEDGQIILLNQVTMATDSTEKMFPNVDDSQTKDFTSENESELLNSISSTILSRSNSLRSSFSGSINLSEISSLVDNDENCKILALRTMIIHHVYLLWMRLEFTRALTLMDKPISAILKEIHHFPALSDYTNQFVDCRQNLIDVDPATVIGVVDVVRQKKAKSKLAKQILFGAEQFLDISHKPEHIVLACNCIKLLLEGPLLKKAKKDFSLIKQLYDKLAALIAYRKLNKECRKKAKDLRAFVQIFMTD